HNPDKLKGKLLLTDSASILKGGKTGELFVAGKPELSLLLKRIHLPLDDKKHMPPSGKTQLTADEIALLYLWIKADAKFSKRVTALPAKDSLRLLATSFLHPDETPGEIFHFASADEHTIKKLNTNYCVVAPLAKQSPALAVNIYNREAFSTKTLDDLKDVKLQIVSLELSRMPVKNADLKKIERFENLRRLNLNFTDITGEGLKTLASLKHLKSLSLSGTQVNFRDLQHYIPAFKSLHTLAVWDTELSGSEIEKLEASNRHIQFLGGFKDDGSHPVKLNAPQVKNKSVVFDGSLQLQLFHPVKGVDIRFTTDGSEPDSITSSLFKDETVLNHSTVIKARAYKQGWLSSDVATLNLYRSAYKPDSVILLTRLNRVHPAKGAKTFFDHELGTFNANSPAWANNWAGFIKNDMDLLLEFKTAKIVSSVAINTLVETETFIFPPEVIEVWGGDSQDNLTLLGKMKPEHPTDYIKPYIRVFDCTFKAHKVSYLKIIAKPVMKIPVWHKSKERPALLLIDEIFIN
ncbi:MAG: chitobiase/beta-hexosaminidase C-terminal domain-containing protein, partial [Cyclobacteriaceae bacterium]